MSISNEESGISVDSRILDAAASCVLAYGVERVTLAEIARRAGVSRPTVYRRFPDTRSILAALLTSRIVGVVDSTGAGGSPRPDRTDLVATMVQVAERLRHDEVIMAVLHSAPELAMVYITERLGTSQQVLIDTVAGQLKRAQDGGGVRDGDPRQLATMCLLMTQSAIQSAQMVAPILDESQLAHELAHALNGYLAP